VRSAWRRALPFTSRAARQRQGKGNMVKFLKVRVMKTIAPSSHPHVRSPRRRPPAGFRSARPRAAPRLFFVATRVAARGRAAPADDGRGADDEARLGDRASPASPRGFTGSPPVPRRRRAHSGRRRTRGRTRDASRAGFSRSRATTAARDGGSGAAHPRARGGVSSRPRPRRRVPRARGARGPAPALAARTPRARRLGFFQLLRCRTAVKVMTGAGGAARFAAIDPLSSRASR
jgi:hypothetical protein